MDRAHRLTSSRDFRHVLAHGRRGAAGAVACSVLRTEGADGVRVGISTGKRIGSAVRRNRAKRVIREAARAGLAQIAPGTDIVIAARPGILSRTYQQVEAELATALRKAGA